MALLNNVIERFPYNTEAIAEKAFLVYSLTRSSPENENEYWEFFKQALEIDGGYSRQYFYLAFIKSEEKEK
jgi:hypothetical protein